MPPEITNIGLSRFKPFGKFITEDNVKFTLLKGFREWIKPDWREMLIKRKDVTGMKFTPALGTIVFEAEQSLVTRNTSFVGKKILEVGCHNGNNAYTLAKFSGVTVHGIDILEYGILQTPDLRVDGDGLENQQKFLGLQRNLFREHSPKEIRDNVSFETIGIENYVKEGYYDAIVTWDTLEHLSDVKTSISNMYKCLKQGGFLYIMYNPFFSINGGHSLCTLDFPYGHCLISPNDFDRYIKTLRPDEYDIAMNFYNKNLNRLTIRELTSYLTEPGFKFAMFNGHIPFEDPWIKEIENGFLQRVNKYYPNAQRDDMIFDQVYIIAVKE